MSQKTNLNINPYYDDFDSDKNFYKVLFKPGFPVQSRELTTLQSILQNQVEDFGSHIFKEGSMVIPGGITYDGQFYAVKVNPTQFGVDLSVYIENFVGKTVVGEISGTTAKIQKVVFPSESDEVEYITLYVKYLDSDSNFEFTPFQDGELLSANENIVYGNTTISAGTSFASLISTNATSIGSACFVGDGVYFIRGYFVNVSKQNIILDYYTNTPSYRVGLKVTESIINAKEDNSLYDNAKGFTNYAAPGADRFKINLVLTSLPYDASSVEIDNYANKDFIQLVRIVRGNIDWVRRLPNYSEILDLLARRTYDESGSYTTKPFALDIKNHLRRDTFELIVQNSPIDSLSNQYLQVGSYIWGITEEELSGDFPFNIQDFSDLTFPVGRIISVVPFRENDINLIDPNVVSKKILVQPLNSVRFSFIPGTYQTFNYQKSSVSVKTTVSATYSRFITDSEGFYSVYDNPSGDTNKLLMSLKPGKAYVYGYEQDFYAPINIEYLKGRSEIDRQTQLSTLSAGQILGNYVVGNFIEHDISLNIDDDTIDWEKLPKFELQSEDIFTLIMEKGENVQASGKVHSWSSFNITSFSNAEQRKMYGFSGPNSTTQEFESVILIK